AELRIQPSAEVTEGTAVTLTCLGTGDRAEKPLYTWNRNGQRLQESSFPTLEFPSVRGEDAGAFQCQVRAGNGSDASEVVPLRVLCECPCGNSERSWGSAGGGPTLRFP
ncbi:SN protein, partial [Illadopsis cleaveri]|nr:SN protein [Illadopsis cleaveri]